MEEMIAPLVNQEENENNQDNENANLLNNRNVNENRNERAFPNLKISLIYLLYAVEIVLFLLFVYYFSNINKKIKLRINGIFSISIVFIGIIIYMIKNKSESLPLIVSIIDILISFLCMCFILYKSLIWFKILKNILFTSIPLFVLLSIFHPIILIAKSEKIEKILCSLLFFLTFILIALNLIIDEIGVSGFFDILFSIYSLLIFSYLSINKFKNNNQITIKHCALIHIDLYLNTFIIFAIFWIYYIARRGIEILFNLHMKKIEYINKDIGIESK